MKFCDIDLKICKVRCSIKVLKSFLIDYSFVLFLSPGKKENDFFDINFRNTFTELECSVTWPLLS